MCITGARQSGNAMAAELPVGKGWEYGIKPHSLDQYFNSAMAEGLDVWNTTTKNNEHAARSVCNRSIHDPSRKLYMQSVLRFTEK